uniref:Sqs1 n=1 Tax=Arundo donax TaxID=35708 RepID=A0A0A9BAG9_ARUDO
MDPSAIRSHSDADAVEGGGLRLFLELPLGRNETRGHEGRMRGDGRRRPPGCQF